MNANTFLSYISKSKPIRVKILVPFEFWALLPTAVGLILSTLVFLFSNGWGIALYIATGTSFLLANIIRNVESYEVMLQFVLNQPPKKVDDCGVKFVIPFVTLCDYYRINQVEREGQFNSLETSDGLSLGVDYMLTILINDELVYIYGQKSFRGTEPTVMKKLLSELESAIKDAAKLYNQRDMIQKTEERLQAAFKAEAERIFIEKFGDYLEGFCGHRDLYKVDLTINNLIYNQTLMEELEKLRQAEVDVEIAERDKQASIIDAEAKAEATRIEGKAKADAIEAEGEALRKNPDVIRLRTAEKSNLQNIVGDGARMLLGGEKAQIITP